ncbi:MAG: HEAT repeat domain-containing protein [Verrucomicrobiae bacterium]|nr:HEAT repeat domain-containing protein [Verrucomicrobiae bacterium]
MRATIAGLLVWAWLIGVSGAQRTPAEYAADLESTDPRIRREAAYQLSRLGQDVREVVPQLIRALNDDEQQVWFGAITALTHLGAEAEPALEPLLQDLEGWQPFRRNRQGSQALYRTAVALGAIGEAAVPSLVERLGDRRWHVRAGAAMALGFAGDSARPGVPGLVVLLGDDRAEVREAATETLARMGSLAVGSLAEALEGGAAVTRRVAAADALGRMGPEGMPAVGVLRLLAMSVATEEEVRAAALRSLGRVDRDPATLLPVLMEAWRGEGETIRAAAKERLLLVRPVDRALVLALLPELEAATGADRGRVAGLIAELGPAARGAGPTLVRMLRQEDRADEGLVTALAGLGVGGVPLVLEALAGMPVNRVSEDHWTLAVLRRVDRTVVGRLEEALGHEVASVRMGALEGLAALGEDARSAAGRVPALMDDAEPAVRARAWLAAARCGVAPAAMVERLDAGLGDADLGVRRAAVAGIAELGAAAAPAVPQLVDKLGADDAALRGAAVRALGAVGPGAAVAVSPLAQSLALVPAGDRVETLVALGRIGRASASAMPEIMETLKAPEPEVRRAAIEAIGRMQEAGQPGLPQVLLGLKDGDPRVRATAVEALVAVDAAGEETVARVTESLEDEVTGVRRAAGTALVRLEQRGRPAQDRLFAMLDSAADRGLAVEALRAIHPTSVPALMRALEHGDWTVREMAADGLARLGREANEAMAALERALREDPYEEVKRASRRALRRIREGS